jgi:acetyl esterase/lipase
MKCQSTFLLPLATALLILLGKQAEAAVSGSIPLPAIDAPKGYQSRAEVMAAILLKKIPLIAKPKELPHGVKEFKNLEYSRIGDRSLELDLYLPENPSPDKPCLVFIHGGSWSGGSRDVYHYYTVLFASKGYPSATVSYRLSGEAAYPAAVHDVKAAVRWLRAKAPAHGFNGDNIVALGGSAGGHLSLMLGYTPNNKELEGSTGNNESSSAVQAVVNFYGPVDLTTKMGQESGAVRKFLSRKTYDEAKDLYEDASPIFHLTKDAPPTLTIHGALDEVVKVRQADMLESKLKKLQVPYAYVKLEGWPHTLDAAQSVNDYTTAMVEAFLTHVFSDNK